TIRPAERSRARPGRFNAAWPLASRLPASASAPSMLRNSGLIPLCGGRLSHGVLDVIIAQHQDLDTNVGTMRRQLALHYESDLLPVEVPGRVLWRVEGELDDAMGCRRVSTVVRCQAPQLSRSLKSIRDRSDPREVLILASGRIVDLVDVLDHQRHPSVGAATPTSAGGTWL